MGAQQKVTFSEISADQLAGLAAMKRAAGWRFVECHANRPYKDEGIEVVWTFANDADQSLDCLETYVQPGEPVDSLRELYPCAVMFEHEMHDLFGIEVTGLDPDYEGGFYHLHYETPMLDRPAKTGAEPRTERADTEATA